MSRPRYQPGSVHTFAVRRRPPKGSLLEYLRARLSLPQGWVLQLLHHGCVQAGGTLLEADDALVMEPGLVFTVTFPKVWPPHLCPTPMALHILYEDAAMLVLNKPAGVVVHPARGHMHGDTLQNGVLHHVKERLGQPDVSVGPAHRLDLETSGAMIYSLTRTTHMELSRQFRDQHPHKEYLAVVDGRPDFEQTHVAAPLGTDPLSPMKCAVVQLHEGGKPAATDLYVLERGKDWALIRANPLTGRPHQVRVHCLSRGLPVLGDKDYHPTPQRHAIQRHALHASALVIQHPVSGKTMRFEADMPEDMKALLAIKREGG